MTSPFSTVLFIGLGLLILVGGLAIILRPSIYPNSRWARDTFNPKLLQSAGYQLQLRAAALVFALFGLNMLFVVAAGVVRKASLRALADNGSVALTIVFFAVFLVGIFLVVAARNAVLRTWLPSEVTEVTSDEQRLKEHRAATVFLVMFFLIVAAVVLSVVARRRM